MNKPTEDQINNRADVMLAEMTSLQDKLTSQIGEDGRNEAIVAYLIRKIARLELIVEFLNGAN